jgi:phosphoserine phosphatase
LPAFRTVVLDVDSTVSGIEGIDWLAARRGDVVARRVADLTNTAMQGGVPLEDVYGLRLNAIRPRREEVDALSRAYVDAIAPGALQTIDRLRRLGVQIVLVSGGLRDALLRLALHLGLSPGDVHAVALRFDAGGAYHGFDATSPMTTSDGKRRMVSSLSLDGPILAVGDGATDLAMRDVVDLFAAFTGFITRPHVVERADVVVTSFEELERIVLSPPDPSLRGAHDRRRSERHRPSGGPSLIRENRPEP